ncbi:hypothetical protein LXA43DRAFT_629738 [Ganoderma leucocontextum]|nr:hypothetical protein LXA43DRAFT_629738 [Ganoderma leucocontextum]
MPCSRPAPLPLPLRRVIPAVVIAAELASFAAAYSFNIVSTPRQCENLTVQITGEGGQAPYSLLIIPFGPSPLPNAVEARRITNVPFNTSTSVDFQLRFPENSQFVAVVSDSTGFGTGGTSAAVTVLSGKDGCFNATTTVSPAWFLHTDPDGVLSSCTTTRIWWNSNDPQGTPNFQGVIPGGQSFSIPVGQTSTKVGTGVGFNWTPDVRISTTFVLVGGDDRGLGVAGSNLFTIQQGSTSCLNGTSPSSTAGSPAGGSYPTSTDGSGTNSGQSGSTNVGAIVGGVIGGVVGLIAIALVVLFFSRRRRFNQNSGTKERPVDLLHDGDVDNEGHVGDSRLPAYYQPEPFVLPAPTIASSSRHDLPSSQSDSQRDRRISYLSTSTSEQTGSGYGGGLLRVAASSAPSTSVSRKSPVPPSFRAVNIIQHDDAGPEEEPETIELPPAYTNLKPRTAPPPEPTAGATVAESSSASASSP